MEFPVKVKGLFRPHYVGWSEQQRIEFQAPEYLRNIIRIITESGLRVYKELMPMKKEQVDLEMPWFGFRIRRRRTGSLRCHSRIWLSKRFASRFESRDWDLGCFRATRIRRAIKGR